MATKTTKSSSNGLHLAVAFIPTLLSVLYLRSNSLPGMLDISNLRGSVSSLYSTARTNITNVNPFNQLAEQYAQACPEVSYKTRIFSLDPLIIYVENYITAAEREYIIHLAGTRYTESKVAESREDSKIKGFTSPSRTSQSAYLYDDPVSFCIMERSARFQGNSTVEDVEDLQAVKYAIGNEFRSHFDWFDDNNNPRISTFFAYLACDSGDSAASGECEGGATQFPDWSEPWLGEWCDVVDCYDDSELGGVAFKPVVGNAIFWSNVHPNGTYHQGVLHAGMPVRKGRKVGLNIWTRQGPFEYQEEAEDSVG